MISSWRLNVIDVIISVIRDKFLEDQMPCLMMMMMIMSK